DSRSNTIKVLRLARPLVNRVAAPIGQFNFRSIDVKGGPFPPVEMNSQLVDAAESIGVNSASIVFLPNHVLRKPPLAELRRMFPEHSHRTENPHLPCHTGKQIRPTTWPDVPIKRRFSIWGISDHCITHSAGTRDVPHIAV